MRVADAPVRSVLRTVVLSSLAALALYLSYPPATLWWCTFLWPMLLLATVRAAPSLRCCAIVVCLTHMPTFALLQWWVMDVSALGMPGFVVYLSICWACVALLLRALDLSMHARVLRATMVLPLGLLCGEFLRGDLVCGGYPWFFAGHPLIESTWLSQCADLFGAATLTLIVGLVGGSLMDARNAWSAKNPRGALLGLSFAACVLSSASVYGWMRFQQFSEEPPTNASRILVVQTSVPTSNKLAWTPTAQVEDTKHSIALTLEGLRDARAAGDAPILVVWPETMLPGLGLEPDTIALLDAGGYWPGARFSTAVADLVTVTKTPLLVGSAAYVGLRIEGTGDARRFAWDHQFNSVYLVRDDAPYERYDKIFLTPFGETMPVISSWPWLESNLLALGAEGMTFDLDAGSTYTRFTIPTKDGGAIRIATPICFEDSVGWVLRRMVFGDHDWTPWNTVREADVLVAPSNDGWFGTSASSRAQHFDFARLRAIEFRTPVVRSVNTGYSTSIDAAGSIRAVVGSAPRGTMDVAGTLLATVHPRTDVPLSARVADLLSWSSVLCCGALFFRSWSGAHRLRKADQHARADSI
ncbi:MAG: apolipoprotein N-acyltransferase [Phycisphaerales bacterium]|nr:apolipoprotein N-acyltransferase [Phycisphaerales bacterium]